MKSYKRFLFAFVLILPFLVHTCLFVFYPLINTILLSFKEDYNLLSDSFSSYGVSNYYEIFNDKYFVQSVTNTTIYSIIVVPITMILALIIALALNKKLKFYSFFQTVFFLPMVTASTAIAYAWRLIFNGQYGVLNEIIGFFGGTQIQWLTMPQYSMIVISIIGVWNMLPFSIITTLSSLQSIDNRLYIAAEIDGANSWLKFKRITLPAILPNIVLLLIINSISAFRVFDILFPIFSGRPGPSYNMYTMVYYIYEQMQSFSKGSYGRAAAAAIILSLIIGSLSLIALLIKRSISNFRKGALK